MPADKMNATAEGCNPAPDDTIEIPVRIRVPRSRGASRWMAAKDSPLGQALVRRLVRTGVIASARPARDLLIDRDQHDAWIAQHADDNRVTGAPSNDADDELDLAIVGGVR